jgi:putative peptide zinc metalloprotease protein
MSSAPPPSAQSSPAARRRYRLRNDLRIEPQLYGGEPCFIVKDPVSLAYFRFTPQEHDVLRLLTGRTVAQVADAIERRLNRPRPSDRDLSEFLARLTTSGLVVHNGRGRGTSLLKFSRDTQQRKKRAWWRSLLYIKFPGVDPEPFLRWLHPRVRWLYSRAGVTAAALLVLFAFAFTLVRIDEFVDRVRAESLEQFFSVQTVFWLWVALGVSKVLHELGHGVTCKHFGGECHDMGMLLLIFCPCLYCDASDAWTMPSKWRRIAISAGGIYVELIIASLASLVWWHTQPGVVHSIALALMTICSINTVFVNANPLLRFDGYYILSDLLEVPNLRQKSRDALYAFVRRNLFGISPPAKFAWLSPGRRRLFLTYAITSWVYRWLLCLSILWFFYTALRPYRLGSVSVALAIAVAARMLISPLVRELPSMLRSPHPATRRRWGRVFVSVAVLAGIAAAIVLAPLPHRVPGVLIVQGTGQQPVHAVIAGRLDEVAVDGGKPVRQGDVLARLSNPGLELEIQKLEAELRRLELTAVKHAAMERPGEEQATHELLQRTREELAARRDQWERLTVRAACDGRIVPARRYPASPASTRGYRELLPWLETPLRPENIGAWLDAGTPLCDIQPSAELEAVMLVEQTDVAFVEPGQAVRLKFDALPGETSQAVVREIARREAEEVPEQLLSAAGGELPSTQVDGRLAPATVFYEVRASLQRTAGPDPLPVDDLLRYGSRGRARIDCGRWTCWQWIVREVHELFFL